MEKLNGEQVFNLFKKLNLDTGNLTPEALDWVVDKPGPNKILSWMCKYIDESNVDDFSNCSGASMTPKDLTLLRKYIPRIDSENKDEIVEEILAVNQHKIYLLEKRLENAKREKENKKRLKENYSALETEFLKQLLKMKEKHADYVVEKTSLANGCLKKAKILSEKIQVHCENMLKIKNMFTNSNGSGHFYCQMPWDEFQKCEKTLLKKLDVITSKNLKNVHVINENRRNCSSFITEELSRLKNSLEENMTVLLNLKFKRMTAETSTTMECTQDKFNSNLNKVTAAKIPQIAKSHVNHIINLCLLDIAKHNYKINKQILSGLQSNYGLYEQVLQRYTLALNLLKRDRVNAKNLCQTVNKISEIIQEALENFSDNLNMMHRIAKSVPVKSENINVTMNMLVLRNHALLSSKKVELELKALRSCVRHINEKYTGIVKQYTASHDEYQRLILSGPTTQPALIPYKHLQNVWYAEDLVVAIKSNITNSMDEFLEIQEFLEKNRWKHYERILWQFFLVRPDVVEKILYKLKEHINENVKES